MKLTKKLLAIMLSLIMVFTMIAVPVSAAGTIAEDTAVEEVVGEETTDEEAAEEESVGEFHEIFEAIKNLIEAIHNLVGGIMGNLGKECPFCGEVHDKDEGETEEPDTPEVPDEPVEPDVPDTPDEPEEIVYTKAEWINILVNFYNYPTLEDSNYNFFNDIEVSPYKEAIEKAVVYGLLEPTQAEFYPDEFATREFAVVTAIKSLGFQPTIDIDCADLKDISYPKEVNLAVQLKMFSLVDNKFYPLTTLKDYEAEKILEICQSVNSSTELDENYNPEGIVFYENVITLEDVESYDDDGSNLTLPINSLSTLPSINQIIVVNKDKAYKVIGVTSDSDYIYVEYKEPELFEFVDKIDLQGESNLDFAEFIPAEGVTVVQNEVTPYSLNSRANDDINVPGGSVNVGVKINLSGDVDLGDGYKFKYSLNGGINKVSYKFDVDCHPMAILPGGKPFVDVKNAFVTIQHNLTFEAEIGSFYENEDRPRACSDVIQLGSIPVLGIDGVGILVEISVKFTAEGKFELLFNFAGTSGTQILNNVSRKINDVTASSSYGIEAEIAVGPSVYLVAEVVGKDLLSFGLDIGVKASGYVKYRTTGMVCVDARVSLYFEMSAFDRTLIDDWLEVAVVWKIWDENNNPLKKVSLHFENMVKVPECTYEEGGILKGRVANADNRTEFISGARVDIYNATNDNLIKTLYTTENGSYSVTIPGGAYTIRVSANGYIPFESLEHVLDQQETYAEAYLMVEGSEYETTTSTVGGKITNAVTGQGVADVTLTIRKGWNKTSSPIIRTTKTNSSGLYSVELPIGNYTILMEKENYITDHFNIAVTRTINPNCHSTMTPDGNSTIPTGDLRIVLTWGSTPSDLDSHLWGPTVTGGSNFHVFYGEKNYSFNGITQSFLDLDDTSSYGPETTTIYSMGQSGIYSFLVYDFSNGGSSNSTAMSNSSAKVNVYVGDELIATYHVPTSKTGTVWHVFDFDANTRTLIPINTFSNHYSGSSNVGSNTNGATQNNVEIV